MDLRHTWESRMVPMDRRLREQHQRPTHSILRALLIQRRLPNTQSKLAQPNGNVEEARICTLNRL